MELSVVEEQGVRAVEGPSGQPLMARVTDINRVLEACAWHETAAVLLYVPNLTPAFFNLSSGEAGEILQKLRNYHIRLAIVCPPGSVRFSSRFGEMLIEEGQYFKISDSRHDALAWLGATARP